MKYIIAILSAFLFVSLAAVFSLTQSKKILTAELDAANANYELIKTHIEHQNAEIDKANETLKLYKGKIGELQKEYDTKIAIFQKQIKNIKTCEDGFNYLKNMLDDLKGIQ